MDYLLIYSLSFFLQVALQINDTHPSIAIAEVMRVLVDEEHLDWSKAWGIACKIFSVTIHAVQPEALEKVPIDLLGSVLPRHLEVCFLSDDFVFFHRNLLVCACIS